MLNDLGNAYVAAGDVSNAIDTLREAGEASRVEGACAERSGQCVCGSGDVSNAIDTLRGGEAQQWWEGWAC